MRTNEQTRSRQGRGTRGDGRTPSALRAARGEGPGPGGRGAPQLPGRATAAPAARLSTGLHHCSPCTHTRGGPDPDSGGKTGSPAPDGQAGPSQGRTGAPTSQAPGPVPAEGAGRAGGWGGAGRGSRAPAGLSPPPQGRGGGATTWRLTSSYQDGPWALSHSQASSGLVVYSVTNALFPS